MQPDFTFSDIFKSMKLNDIKAVNRDTFQFKDIHLAQDLAHAFESALSSNLFKLCSFWIGIA